MKIFKKCGLFFIFISTHIYSRDPFKFNYQKIQPKIEESTSVITPCEPTTSKWTIKEQGDQIMILENCDGQLRAVEIPH